MTAKVTKLLGDPKQQRQKQREGLREKFYQGVRKPIPDPLASGALVKSCIDCWYSNEIVYKTVTVPRFTNRLIVIVVTRPVATGEHSGAVPQVFFVPHILLCPEKFVLTI